MKYFNFRLVAVLAFALVLSGCSSTSSTNAVTEPVIESSAPVATAVETVDAAAVEKDKAAAAWVEYVRNRATTLSSKSDEDLILIARTACSSVDDGQLFEEVVFDLLGKELPAAQEKDQILLLGTGIASFCPEYSPERTGDETVDFLANIRNAAPSIAHNSDDAILSQARTACPTAKEGPAGGAKVVSVSREAWGNKEGYRFAFLSISNFCSDALGNIAVNK